MGLGPCTNNNEKLLALKLLLCFSKEKDVKTLHIFWNSILIINWAGKTQFCHNMMLLPLLEDVLAIKHTFDSISLQHVYKERNQEVDRLSKEGVLLAQGHLKFKKIKKYVQLEYFLQPFL
jgi:hypothetical protein